VVRLYHHAAHGRDQGFHRDGTDHGPTQVMISARRILLCDDISTRYLVRAISCDGVIVAPQPEIHRVDPEFGSTLTVSNRDSQSNCWVNLRIWVNPVNFTFTQATVRDHRPAHLIPMFYPQDTTLDMGPTSVIPGTHLAGLDREGFFSPGR
jgi:hypothetical protein